MYKFTVYTTRKLQNDVYNVHSLIIDLITRQSSTLTKHNQKIHIFKPLIWHLPDEKQDYPWHVEMLSVLKWERKTWHPLQTRGRGRTDSGRDRCVGAVWPVQGNLPHLSLPHLQSQAFFFYCLRVIHHVKCFLCISGQFSGNKSNKIFLNI